MLSREENEMLTRVNACKPMGELMPRYRIPALLSEEIPTANRGGRRYREGRVDPARAFLDGRHCPPVRVRLLGEDLVAFRDSNGKIGLLGELRANDG